MAVFIPNVVDTTLTFGTVPIVGAAFNIPVILTSHVTTANRADIYTSYQAVLDAGWHPESPAATMANLLFSGVAKPSQVVIGRRALDKFTVDVVGAVTDGTVYSVKLKTGTTSTTFSYTATVPTDDAAAVVTALKAAIDADGTFNTVVTTTVATNTLEITLQAGKTVDVAAVLNTTTAAVTTETVADALAAVAAENSTWFWMMGDSHIDTDVKAMAAYAEANDRMYAFSSQDADIKNDVLGNTLQDLKDLGYQHTWFVMYATDANTTFPEAGGVGAIANANPGTTTMHGKTLKGVTVNSLTTTEIQNILNNNGNVYLQEFGVNFYRDGRVVDGNFVDTISFGLWLKARIAESLFGLLKRKSDLLEKVSFSENGLATIRQQIYDNPIRIAINRGAILNELTTDSDGNVVDLRPVISTPLRGDIPTNDIASRVLNDVVVEVVYASPIHYVSIKIGVILNR